MRTDYRFVPGIIFLLFFSFITAQATDYYVSVNGDNENNGTSPDQAWSTITHAVSQVNGTANNPAIIHISEGTYDRNHERDFPISINGNSGYIELVGAGPNTIIDGSGAPPWDNYWIFDINSADAINFSEMRIINARGAFRIRNIDGDMTFTNMQLAEFEFFPDGTGTSAFTFDSNSGNIFMDNMILDDPINDQNGGAFNIDENGGTITLNNITMSNPTARWADGGALYVTNTENDIVLNNWEISNPWANDDGGTIYVNNLDGNFTATNVNVEHSIARYNNGGVLYLNNIDGSVTINHGIYNTPHGDDHGGSIYINDINGNCSINDISIVDGTGVYGRGGAFYVNDITGNTVISNITINNISSGNEGGSIYVAYVDGSLDLDNISITDTRSEWSNGGGIYIRDADNGTLLNNVSIINSYAHHDGGGMYLYNLSGNLTLQNVGIENSDAFWGDGGGIFMKNITDADSIIIDGLALCANTCFGGHGSNSGGGGMYFNHNQDDSPVRISNFSIIGNSTGAHDTWNGHYHNENCHNNGNGQGNGHGNQHGHNNQQDPGYNHHGWGHGGGMFLYKIDSIDIANGTILWNETVDDDAYHEWNGGGIYFDQVDNVNIENVVFWENLARGSGGGIYVKNNHGSFNMFNVGFMANYAIASDRWSNGYGGAFYYDENQADGGPDYLVRNALFVDNYCDNDGGAIYVRKGNLDLVNMTVANNYSERGASSVYVRNNQDVNIYNSIIWGNGDGTGREITVEGNRLDIYYSDVEGPLGTVVDGPGNININPFYYDSNNGRYNVRFGSRTLDAGMPDDPGVEGYVAEYADYSHEAEPNYSNINMGFWGMLTGNGLDCDFCGGAGSIGNSNSGQGGSSQPGGAVVVEGGFGGAAGGVSSEALLLIIQDQYVMMGVPVIPSEDQMENDPQDALGDDVGETVPHWDPDEMLQTWRFSRWTQNYVCPQAPNGFTGYLRFDENEPGYGEDLGNPPPIIPGRGYWFVYNYGARLEAMITVDVSKFMLEAQDYVLPLDPWLGTGQPALNMMANPWPFPIDWAEILISDSPDGPWVTTGEAATAPYNWIEDWAYSWDHANEEYIQKNRRLEVWEGFWMMVHSTDSLYVKFPPLMVDMDVPAVELDELDEILDWSLLLTAERTDRLQVDYHTWIGVGEELSDEKDKWDAYQLSPQAKESVFLRSRVINQNGNHTDRLTYDFRANDLQPGVPKAWLMEMYFYVDDPAIPEAYPVDVSIRWPTISGVPDNIQLKIHDYVSPTFNPDPDYILVDDMRDTEEFIVHVDQDVANYPDYKIRKFWISATEVAGIMEFPDREYGLPTVTQISSIAPNPFNNATTVHFDVSKQTNVVFKIYNALGQELTQIHQGVYNPGYHQFTWNANNVSSGVYFIRFEADGVKLSMKKLVLLK